MRRSSKPQRSAKKALKARGITPGKVTKSNRYGQASGGWSPFGSSAPVPARMEPVDDVEYDAFDRVKRGWFTNKPKGK
jgi:hypothetical protein